MTNKNNYTEGLEELLTELDEPGASVAAYSEDDDAVTQLLESPLSDQEWMVQVSALDRRMMSTAQVLDELSAGSVNASTLVWRGGMDDWAELASVPELSQSSESGSGFESSPGVGGSLPGEPESEAAQAPLAAAAGFGMRNNTTRPVALDSLPDLNPRASGINKGFVALGAVAVLAVAVIAFNFNSSGEPAAAAGPGAAMAQADSESPGAAEGATDPTAVQAIAAIRPSPMEEASADEPSADQPSADEPSEDEQSADEQSADEQVVGKALVANGDSEEAESGSEATAAKQPQAAAAAPRPKVRRRARASRRRAKSSQRKESPRRALVRPASQVTEPEGDAESSSGFDRLAAREKLELAAAKAANCRPPGGPTGTGRVQIRYAPSGEVSQVNIQTEEFQNTTTGGCVRMLFRRASVPEFKGAGKTVTTSFTIPE